MLIKNELLTPLGPIGPISDSSPRVSIFLPGEAPKRQRKIARNSIFNAVTTDYRYYQTELIAGQPTGRMHRCRLDVYHLAQKARGCGKLGLIRRLGALQWVRHFNTRLGRCGGPASPEARVHLSMTTVFSISVFLLAENRLLRELLTRIQNEKNDSVQLCL